MTFIYPIFLWGLAALAIPIIVHLFNFRKAKRVSFSNVRFLESIKKKSSSNLRLRHLLILFCRLLFVFFLILTFAQPVVPTQEEGLQNRSVAIYLDNSNSLSNLTSAGISGFNEVLGVAQAITWLYPAETRFSLVTNEFLPGHQVRWSQSKTSEFFTEIAYSSLSRSGREVFYKLRENDGGDPKDIFILTDFQESTIGEIESFTDSVNQYHLIKTDMIENNNIFVDTVFLSNPFLVPKQKNAITVRIKNQGPAVNDLHVKFFINNRQSATTSIDIETNANKEVIFELTGTLDQANRCLISFEDFPVSFDNDYYFTLNQASKINIVEISNANNSPVSQVYQNNDLFSFRTFSSDNISYPVLEQADLVILNALDELSNGLRSQVEKLLKLGKSVIFVPNGGLNGTYQLAGIRITKDSSSNKIPLALPDIRNPFFENIFESLAKDTQMPDATSAYSWSGNGLVLLEDKTGQPYLSQTSNKGKFYLIGSPLSSEFTNFHQHALFVPVMQRIAELSSDNSQALAYGIDQTDISVSVDSISNGQLLYKLVREGEELIPSQRMNANELVLDMPKYLLSPGFYDLKIDDSPITTIAFNHAKRESDLTNWSMEEIKSKFSGIKHLNLYESLEAESFSKIMKEKYQQRELWKYALILSLVFLFAESVLLRFL